MDNDQSTTKILFPLLYSVEVGEERTVTSRVEVGEERTVTSRVEVGEERTVTSRVEVGEERTVTSPPQKYCFCCFIL